MYASDIAFHHAIAGVRVCLSDDGYIVNPTYPQVADSRLDLIVVGSRNAITMVEAGAREASEAEMLGAIDFGHWTGHFVSRFMLSATRTM